MAARETVRLSTAMPLLGGAVLMTAVLLIPRAGLFLASGLLAASVRLYAAQIGAAHGLLPRRAETHDRVVVAVPDADTGAGARAGAGTGGGVGLADDEDHAGDDEDPPRRVVYARWGLVLAATLVVVAPILIRNRGHALPVAGSAPWVRPLTALAWAGWLAMPVALLAAHARDRRGPLPPHLALSALVRHPLASLAALLVVPLGLLATEGLAALLALGQGELPLMIADLFPLPRFAHDLQGDHLHFDYDGTRVSKLFGDLRTLVPIYPLALRHGFTLIGTIPPSLSLGLFRVRVNPWMYDVNPVLYLVSRLLLSLLIFLAAGIVLTLQARWLGLIAAIDPRRPPTSPAADSPEA
jgi:hypothetical protein